MSDLKKTLDKKLVKLLHEIDDMCVLEEVARRINLGLIPLAMVEFSKLSNKKLRRLDTLTNCSWTIKEICKRMDEGKMPSRVITLEQLKQELSDAKKKVG